MRTLACLAAALAVGSCNKKTDDDTPAPKLTAPDKPPEAGRPAVATVPVTSKSAEAIKVFEQGRDLTDHERGAEAVALFKKAIQLDPDFAQAHAYLGIVTQGPPGLAELDKAAALAKKLPDAERLTIEAARAGRNGERAAMLAAYNRIAEIAPTEWRAWVALGWDANDSGDYSKAIPLFEKALAVKPDLAPAQDGLAYGRAGQREWDAAIAAAKKQVELAPKQPNPQDTLGEILLMAGKFDDAEKAFRAALAIEPKYNTAWQGVALSRAYRGDWKGAFEANAAQNGGAVDTYDSVNVIEDSAWLALAANNLPDALARLDVIERDPEAKQTASYAFVALVRAAILIEAEKFADAAKWLDTARKRGAGLPPAIKRTFGRDLAIDALRLAALTAKPAADADKLVTSLDDDAKAGDPTSQSYAAWGHGLATWAKRGPKDATAELAKCRVQLIACRYDLADAQRKGGDNASAAATETQIRGLPQRAASAVYYVTDVAKP